MNKNIIPKELRNNTKFFDHDDDETNLDKQLDKFLTHVKSNEEIIEYKESVEDKTVSIIWTTNYVLFPAKGLLGDSYLSWIPRNPETK